MTAGDDLFGDDELFGDRLYNALDKRTPEAGSLLISAPDMADPTFGRSIVYVVDHGPSGTLGVVLTHRSEMPVAELLPAWAPGVASPGYFHIGGPVSPDTGLALAVVRPGTDTSSGFFQPVDGRVHLLDLDGDPRELLPHVESMRIFVGHAGWTPGQLDEELDRGDWYVTPGLPDDIVAPGHVDVWAAVLRRQEMPLPLYATYVPDGEVN